MKDVPQYIYPFIKQATDVPRTGLCAFSSVAVSLGLTPDAASAVRTQLAQHFKLNYAWYEVNIPKFATHTTNIGHIDSILESTALTVPPDLWFPMPMGGYIIANTFNRPVFYYSPSDASSSYIPPCMTSYHSSEPIVMDFIEDNHFISLELDLRTHLPIPFLHPAWLEVCLGHALQWNTSYEEGRVEFLKLKWQRDWIAKQDGNYTGEVIPDMIELNSEGDKDDQKADCDDG